ncbi:MAG TPA: GxxExxY protein [Candidatus Hodarchaeales archaeon]|nr:GxxExxY protein [Candidatus Hodarchaeales archaeon]
MTAQDQDGMTENEIGKIIVDCAVRLHMELGPGLLETVYEILLVHLLQEAGLKVERQLPIPIQFRGVQFDEGFRADVVVEDKVILELKSVERVSKAHKKQVLTYLKLTGKKLGYLLNFGEGYDEGWHLPRPEWAGNIGTRNISNTGPQRKT